MGHDPAQYVRNSALQIKSMINRVFLIVLDSFGVGFEPDAEAFGDVGANTLKSCASSSKFQMDHLIAAGLGNMDGVDYLSKAEHQTAAIGRLQERSMGKDTTVGHWEIAGVVSDKPLPTYPDGFPEEVLNQFREATGRNVLCNKPYSGTDVIRDYGREHVETGDLIVYTSADSVFQIAAHEDVVPPEQLYEYCKIARKILQGEHGVGRVIARPFNGEWPYTRTPRRHDFSLEPPAQTLLDAIVADGKDVAAVGKIHDIFAGRGISEFVYTTGNTDGLEKTLAFARKPFRGLCFVNLVDFDMVYGHRRNVDGYAEALHEFDAWVPDLLAALRDDDIVMITADHGCDPAFLKHTDHTREYVPLIAFGKQVRPVNLGTRNGFCDIAATIAECLNIPYTASGNSFAKDIFEKNKFAMCK